VLWSKLPVRWRHSASAADASFLLYQKGRDSRIFQAQDRAIDDFTLKGCGGIGKPAFKDERVGQLEHRRSKFGRRETLRSKAAV
jgi:hypothetical protein